MSLSVSSGSQRTLFTTLNPCLAPHVVHRHSQPKPRSTNLTKEDNWLCESILVRMNKTVHLFLWILLAFPQNLLQQVQNLLYNPSFKSYYWIFEFIIILVGDQICLKKKKIEEKEAYQTVNTSHYFWKTGLLMNFFLHFWFPKFSSICTCTFISNTHTLFSFTFFKSQGNLSFSLWDRLTGQWFPPEEYTKPRRMCLESQPPLV